MNTKWYGGSPEETKKGGGIKPFKKNIQTDSRLRQASKKAANLAVATFLYVYL